MCWEEDGSTQPEWIVDPQLTTDDEAMLHVLAVEQLTAGAQRRCDDEGIVDREAVPLGEHHRFGMRLDIDRVNCAGKASNRDQRLAQLIPVEPKPPTRDIGELIKDLHADVAASPKQLFGNLCPLVLREGIDQDIGIEKRAHALTRVRLVTVEPPSRRNRLSQGANTLERPLAAAVPVNIEGTFASDMHFDIVAFLQPERFHN